MSEVGGIQVQGQQLGRTNASSAGPVVAERVAGGNSLPPAAGSAAIAENKSSTVSGSHEIDNAVASLNDYVQSIERDLHFSVDEDLKRTVVKVVDSDSGDVIRQIPEDVVLELARNLKDGGGLSLLDAIS